MLGEQIYELQAQVTGMKVVSGEPPTMEVTYQGTGSLRGNETTEVGTYVAKMRADGSLWGEGEGIVMTGDGAGLTWKGSGVGHPTGKGMAASWRGAIYYQTASEKFADLNHVAALFEWDIDENGQGSAKIWEWK